jgi:RNA recognition motif-containing protein
MKTKLFVGNLTRSTTEEDVSALFEKVGEVASVEVIAVPKTGKPTCFAFVDMSSPVEAEKAVGMLDGSNLNSRSIRVKMANPREKRPEGGGWYNDPPRPRNPKQNPRRKRN